LPSSASVNALIHDMQREHPRLLQQRLGLAPERRDVLRMPCARRSMPTSVRALIKVRSNLARPPKMVSINRPLGVVSAQQSCRLLNDALAGQAVALSRHLRKVALQTLQGSEPNLLRAALAATGRVVLGTLTVIRCAS
jgi:hypothetical protein